MNRFDEAIKDLDLAIRLDPSCATAYQNRGAAYNGLGQYERAIRDLSEAIRLDPENAGAYTNRGLAHFAIGEYDEAIADLSESIQRAPRNAVPCFNRAQVFDRLGFRERALEDYERALRLDPAMAVAQVALEKLRGELRRARTTFESQRWRFSSLKARQISISIGRIPSARQEIGAAHSANTIKRLCLRPNCAELYVVRGWARLCTGVEGADYDARCLSCAERLAGCDVALHGGVGRARRKSRRAAGRCESHP